MIAAFVLLLAPVLQDPVAELRASEQAAFTSWANDDLPTALRTGAAGVRAAAAELARLDGADALALADEIEMALVRIGTLAEAVEAPGVVRELLEGITIDPRHGAAFARLAFLRADCREKLGLLVDWEIIGPFDNERGRGMKDPTGPETQPDPTLAHPGKVREVSWRSLPETPPVRGFVRLGALVDPSTQVCVLARSWIQSTEARKALLFLGASEEVRVWHDGKPVLEALREHELHSDAFCIPLELRAGWNELVLKVGSREGTPAFVARLAEADTARPLFLEQRAHAPTEGGEGGGVAPLALADDRPPRGMRGEPTARPGAWTRWSADESAEGRYRMSLLERFLHARPEHEHPGRELAAGAVAAAPSELRYVVQHTLTLRAAGSSEEQDVNPWLHSLDAGLALAPGLPMLVRWRADHALRGQAIPERSLELLGDSRSVLGLALRATALSSLGQGALARPLWLAVLEHPDARFFPGSLLAATDVLPWDEARRAAAYDAVIAANGSVNALRERAARQRAADSAGGPAPVLALLAEELERDPWSSGAHVYAAHLLLAQDHPADALGVIDRALELAPERAELWQLRSRALLLLDDASGAAQALERELELDFSADDERRLLEHLRSSVLAGGAAPFHVEYQEPLADVLARHAKATPIEAGDVSREVLLERTVVEVHPDGTAKRYHRSVQAIKNESGARALDRIPLYAHPGEQEVRVLAADVLKRDGTKVGARTGRSGARGGIWVDLPPLEVGDVIDLEFRLDDLRPTFFGNYFGMSEALSPDASVPVFESEVWLVEPRELPLYLHTRNFTGEHTSETLADGRQRHHWRAERIAPVRTESLMPPLEELAPTVQASSFKSWDAMGRWWWHLIEGEIKVSPEMAAKVRELTASATTPRERLRAVYDFVVTDIRYNAWEFGVHGYQPYSAPVIFSRGFGDCKDKAILLRAMLSVVGIEALPVLIRADGRRAEEDHTLALVEHFNHCIAYVPEQEGLEAQFIDGTARHHPLEDLPFSYNGAQVVVVSPDGVQPMRIGVATAEENRDVQRYRVVLTTGAASGEPGVRVELDQEPHGRFDPYFRSRFSGSDEERREEAERLMSATLGALTGGVEAKFSELEDLTRPVEARFAARPTRLTRATEGGFELPAALDKLHLLRSIATETERTTDLLLDVPWSRDTVIEIVLEEGQAATATPAPVKVENEDAAYTWSAEPHADGIVVRESFLLKTPRIPPGRYARFRELCRAVDEAQERWIAVEVRP